MLVHCCACTSAAFGPPGPGPPGCTGAAGCTGAPAAAARRAAAARLCRTGYRRRRIVCRRLRLLIVVVVVPPARRRGDRDHRPHHVVLLRRCRRRHAHHRNRSRRSVTRRRRSRIALRWRRHRWWRRRNWRGPAAGSAAGTTPAAVTSCPHFTQKRSLPSNCAPHLLQKTAIRSFSSNVVPQSLALDPSLHPESPVPAFTPPAPAAWAASEAAPFPVPASLPHSQVCPANALPARPSPVSTLAAPGRTERTR